MQARTLISEDEYLRMTFDGPAMEYVNGELVERSVPSNFHSKVQVELSYIFRNLQGRMPLFARSELHLPLAPRVWRIADLAVYANQEPAEAYPSAPPLIVIEIVSPDDKHEELMVKLEDYLAWGIPHIWLVDPGLRRLHVYSDGGLKAVEAFELPEFGVRIPSGDILK
jgi:Uma2 family endonuclease